MGGRRLTTALPRIESSPLTLSSNAHGNRNAGVLHADLTNRPPRRLLWQHTATRNLGTMTQLRVRAIHPAYLDNIRGAGIDSHGNRLRPFPATGAGEPLRCCLRYAEAGESITLISHAPFRTPSVWREVGPVYIHAAACDGYIARDFDTGPRVLRIYRSDGTMDYDHNPLVPDAAPSALNRASARRVRRRDRPRPHRRITVLYRRRLNSYAGVLLDTRRLLYSFGGHPCFFSSAPLSPRRQHRRLRDGVVMLTIGIDCGSSATVLLLGGGSSVALSIIRWSSSARQRPSSGRATTSAR